MKKLVIFLLVVSLMVVPVISFAQSREASGTTLTQTRTNFVNIAATGQNVTGNPGFLMLTGVAVSAASYVPEYYLWVDETGDLCIASHPTIANESVFPDGDWEGINSCTKVGGQS